MRLKQLSDDAQSVCTQHPEKSHHIAAQYQLSYHAWHKLEMFTSKHTCAAFPQVQNTSSSCVLVQHVDICALPRGLATAHHTTTIITPAGTRAVLLSKLLHSSSSFITPRSVMVLCTAATSSRQRDRHANARRNAAGNAAQFIRTAK